MVAMDEIAVSLIGGERCHLGEGPAYDAASDTAWWFDILERRLFEAKLGAGEVRAHALPFMASALAYVDDERQLLVAEDGLYLRSIADGQLALRTPMASGDIAMRSNDARVHPSGTLWTSTMGRKAEAGAGAIHAFRDGELSRLFAGITIPNAICFSPDGGTGYFADTRENVLHAVPLDPATGLPVGAPSVLHRHRGEGGLDGAVTDAEGLIWCALWGAGRIEAYTPAGERVRTVPVPARQASCPVFVGPDFRRMLVTSAYEDMSEAARAADPHHGRTFLLDVGAKGRPEPRVRLGAV